MSSAGAVGADVLGRRARSAPTMRVSLSGTERVQGGLTHRLGTAPMVLHLPVRLFWRIRAGRLARPP